MNIVHISARLHRVAGWGEVKECFAEVLYGSGRNPALWGGPSYPDYKILMSKSDAFESDILKLLFNATAIANIADNTATSPLTNLFVSLHTADPGETGTQTTNETAYTNYARASVPRTSGGWTVSGTAPTQAANAATVSFPACGTTGATLTHSSVGVAISGATKLLYSGALTAPLIVNSGITPSYAAGQVVCTED